MGMISRLCRCLRREREARPRELQRLDPRALAALGLRRCDVWSVRLRRPFAARGLRVLEAGGRKPKA
jgi:uncharacterized protein YjiS (DUF1127 family)